MVLHHTLWDMGLMSWHPDTTRPTTLLQMCAEMSCELVWRLDQLTYVGIKPGLHHGNVTYYLIFIHILSNPITTCITSGYYLFEDICHPDYLIQKHQQYFDCHFQLSFFDTNSDYTAIRTDRRHELTPLSIEPNTQEEPLQFLSNTHILLEDSLSKWRWISHEGHGKLLHSKTSQDQTLTTFNEESQPCAGGLEVINRW